MPTIPDGWFIVRDGPSREGDRAEINHGDGKFSPIPRSCIGIDVRYFYTLIRQVPQLDPTPLESEVPP